MLGPEQLLTLLGYLPGWPRHLPYQLPRVDLPRVPQLRQTLAEKGLSTRVFPLRDNETGLPGERSYTFALQSIISLQAWHILRDREWGTGVLAVGLTCLMALGDRP